MTVFSDEDATQGGRLKLDMVQREGKSASGPRPQQRGDQCLFVFSLPTAPSPPTPCLPASPRESLPSAGARTQGCWLGWPWLMGKGWGWQGWQKGLRALVLCLDPISRAAGQGLQLESMPIRQCLSFTVSTRFRLYQQRLAGVFLQ